MWGRLLRKGSPRGYLSYIRALHGIGRWSLPLLVMLYWTNPPQDTIPGTTNAYRDLSRIQFWVSNPDCCTPEGQFRWVINKDVRGKEGLRDSIDLDLSLPRIYEIWAIPVDKSGNRAGFSNQLNIDLRRPSFLEWFFGTSSK